jgi:protein-S-isoprenylcysteine O-methyltransferase Ste14
MTTFVWTGGALFVSALAFCGYSYGVTWSHAAAFDATNAGIDAVLFSVFALHHSLFARESVKRWLSRAVPEPMLRSVYVWLASLLLIGVCLAWQPIGGEVVRHTGVPAALHVAAQLAGVLIIALAVRIIDPLELAGIRRHSGSDSLQIAGPYRWVRHPVYSGWLLLTFGPVHMTGDRLLFAGISTLYLLIAMPFEERSLRASLGAAYDDYARRVRDRIVPYVY